MESAPFRRVGDFLEFIKFSHTVFALPFALISMWVAAHGWPSLWITTCILVCMVTARTAAMCFNRLIDWGWDVTNPRTQNRSKLASKPAAVSVCLSSIALFKLSCFFLNKLCLILSPVAVFIIFFYSFTKRFTALSHAFLGLALAAAPMGAWAAVTGELTSPQPWCLAAAVLCWVWGFDLVYATQDAAFDQKAGLYSFPSRYGIPAALRLARLLHITAWLILVAFGLLAGLSVPYWLSLAAVAGALIYEHRLSGTGDLAKINRAFFEVNAVVSLLLLAGVGIGIWTKFS